MKKIVCFLLALTLVCGVVGMALASSVSASYEDGVLSVSASIDEAGFFMVKIDGGDTGRSVSASSGDVSIKKTLDAGSHTVTVENDIHGVIASRTINVPGADPTAEPVVTEAPTAEPVVTEAPTAEPVVTETPVVTEAPTEEADAPLTLSTPKYKNGVITFSVSGLKGKNMEVWLDGASTGLSLSGSGSYSLNKRLKAGTHTLTIFNPALGTKDADFEVVITDPSISGSYTKVGTLNVNVSDLNNPSEVWLDGAASSLSVSKDGSYTLSVTLTEGKHTLMLFDQINNKKAYATVTVDHIWKITPAKDATCTEDGNTEGQVCLNPDCLKVEKELVVIPALGHDVVVDAAVPATCTKTGLTEGAHCARCEEVLTAQEVVPALGHKYVVVDKTPSKITYKCQRCGDSFTVDNNKTVKNAYGKIVKDANLVDVDYTAAANKADDKILVIVADLTSASNLTTELGLYLSEDLIAQIIKEGFTTVNFLNGEASILIDLNAISGEWFATDAAIWNYVFSTDPADADGIMVKVEAQISGTEKVAADVFSGVTLKKADGDVAVTENGIY